MKLYYWVLGFDLLDQCSCRIYQFIFLIRDLVLKKPFLYVQKHVDTLGSAEGVGGGGGGVLD